jgi:peptidoglycan/LPS O-acetylase OafA/YrhL
VGGDQAKKEELRGRHIYLEAARGLAALAVVGSHAKLAFFPEHAGVFDTLPKDDLWTGSPLFVLVNGTGAVVLFFVLSGFVLTQRALAERDHLLLIRNTIKRYPRLVLPILVSILLSCALFMSGLYFHEAAAAVTQSPWLATFASAGEPQIPSWWNAFREGLWDVYWQPHSYYNSSLWTMYYEFAGSLMVLGAAFLVLLLWRVAERPFAWIIPITLCVATGASPWFLSFAAGFALAMAFSTAAGVRQSRAVWQNHVLMGMGLYCLGYLQPEGIYSWLRGLNSLHVNLFGACLLIFALLCYRAPNGLTSRVARFLGELSFPVYLVHVPILCSVVSWLFSVFASHDGDTLRWAMFVLTLVAAVAGAMPLVLVNRWWLSWLNRAVDGLMLRCTNKTVNVADRSIP